MNDYRFETLDVFTDRRFGGNPLAVFTDAEGMADATMQRLAAEMNLSETSFVLPPRTSGSDAFVRIFTRTGEMPFAGHPTIGTAWALARARGIAGEDMRIEVPAGLVEVRLRRDAAGEVTGARVAAPQPLTTGGTLAPATVAACVGIDVGDVVTTVHPPIEASVGAIRDCRDRVGGAGAVRSRPAGIRRRGRGSAANGRTAIAVRLCAAGVRDPCADVRAAGRNDRGSGDGQRQRRAGGAVAVAGRR